MKRRHITALAVLVALSAVLAGCVAPGGAGVVDTSLTLEDAKATAMRMERELAALVPADVVASVDQDQTGVLMSCSGDRAYQWTGQTKVVLTEGATYDGAAVTENIAQTYDASDSYRTNTDLTSDGEPRAHVIGEFGQGYLVALSVDKTFVQILSFSPCFVLPEGMWPGDDY
ncbi:hypothetical protein AB0870_10010 [Microbacterium proteolyticum]|uniref:hypothetical protein n=1 Tax=Microbacterium proteolyticum TaxID=1572644 RepID=UPI0024169A01|nr:hypothetical protein [Microbacterium proteolyticum]